MGDLGHAAFLPGGDERELVETPGRRLRVAVLLRALVDVQEGGRLRREALAWLLDTAPRGEGLRARDLFEELGLDADECQRALKRTAGRYRVARLAAALAALPDADVESASSEGEVGSSDVESRTSEIAARRADAAVTIHPLTARVA